MNDNKEVDTIKIPIEEYNELLNAKMLLDALEAYGVDNWSGFELAINDVEFIDEI